MAENPFAQFTPRPSAAPATNPFAQFAPLAQPKTFEREGDEMLYRELLAKEQERRAGPSVPMSGYDYAPTAEEEAIKLVQERRGREGEKAAFDASRTPLKRVVDTSTFLLSLPVRAATRGEYGIGDVAGVVSPDAKRTYDQAEADFARANKTELEYLAQAGEAALGVPALSSMGAVPGQVLRNTSLATESAARRVLPNQVGNIAREGVGLPPKPLAPFPPRTPIERRTGLRNERLADVEAFEASGVKPFGPALTESGVAGTTKQLSEAPIVGAPVRNKLEAAITETKAAGERIAGEYGSARSYRDVGNVVEKGLERFKDARSVDTIESAAAKLSDAELANVARTPARETSIKTKQDALYERAWRGIPPAMAKGRSVKGDDRFLGGMTNTQKALKEIAGRNQRMFSATRGNEAVDAKLAYPVRGGVAGQVVEDVIEGRWRGNLQSMRDVRSNFRRLASGMADTERNTLQLSDMHRLQSAMTQDMIALLERNALHYEGAKGGKKGKARAVKIRRAIHDFRRADQFTRTSVGRLETLEKLYGAQSAEQLGMNILKDAMGGRKGGNFQRLSSLRRSLREEEWGDVASGVIRELGRPLGSARGAAEDVGFSVQSFTTNWNNMSTEGRNALFKNPHTKQLGQALDKFARVADRMANFEALTNTSRSATNALGMGGLLSIITAAQQAVTGNLQGAATAASGAAGLYAFGKFMTSPTYVKWLTRAAELSNDPGKFPFLRGHAKALGQMAEREPDFQVQNLLKALGIGLDQQMRALEEEKDKAARGRAQTARPALPPPPRP